jgi:tRNA-uridine 2-sulfurtransferase
MTQVRETVVVGMSGGVDSSVAAALLKEQGYKVIGVMLRLWTEPGMEFENRCCTPDDMAAARRVAAMLDIPFYALDVRDRFRSQVVQAFIDGYEEGITPNPCMTCNRSIRWGFLLSQAESMGGSYLATGHYARVQKDANGRVSLKRAVDEQKDQSYIISVLSQEQLSKTIFPLGEFHKTEVRELARKFGLPVAEKADSQDLCFLGNGNYHQFLIRNAPDTMKPGEIVNTIGQVIGTHEGLAFYTIGQRKGLKISSPVPLYVIDKQVEKNLLVVGTAEELGGSDILVRQFHWINQPPTVEKLRAEIKIRYKSRFLPGDLYPEDAGSVRIHLDEPARDITPGQLAVVYLEDSVLGSGVIQAGNLFSGR